MFLSFISNALQEVSGSASISTDPSAKHLKLDHSALAFAPSTASVSGYRKKKKNPLGCPYFDPNLCSSKPSFVLMRVLFSRLIIWMKPNKWLRIGLFLFHFLINECI